MTTLLRVDDLHVEYRTRRGVFPAVRGVSLEVFPGRVTALVGESGSGKSTVAQSVIGLLAAGGAVTSGAIELGGSGKTTSLLHLSDRQWRAVRGARIGLIPQDPSNALNPVTTIGTSVAEGLRIHGWHDRERIRTRVLELLERVGIDKPEVRARQYPHELSGGMRQRVLIAAAIALEPELIIADEPTSALDVTVQRTVLDLIDELRRDSGTGVLFITHDLAVAADRSESIVVMRHGTVQESGSTATVLRKPASDYTRALLADAPSITSVVERVPPLSPGESTPLVEVSGLRQEFRVPGSSPTVAVEDVSFRVDRGTTHALVGESGSGKTTTGRSIVGFNRPTAGNIRVGDIEVTSLRNLRTLRRRAQLVYQNPYGSLDPRQSVRSILIEPMRNFRIGSARERDDRVAQYLDLVSLSPDLATRHPHELSGGQRQRVAIARALIVEPELVVLDEAVSALDVTVQAQILRLLADLQAELGLTYVFISHDLAVVRQIADTVSVLHRGVQVEHGTVSQVFQSPQTDYTRTLLNAIPGRALRTSPPPKPTRHDPEGNR